MNKFRVYNINDLELLYSVLRETYPKNEIEIVFNLYKKKPRNCEAFFKVIENDL